MVAVAVVAACLVLVERQQRLRRISIGHAMERGKIQASDLDIYLLLTSSSHEDTESEATRTRLAGPIARFIEYHGQMAEKYDHASRRPWLPVAPDPPPPSNPSRKYVKEVVARYCRIPIAPDPAGPK